RDMASCLDVDRQDTAAEVGENSRQQPCDFIGSFRFTFASQLQNARVHFRDGYHRNKKARAVATKPLDQLRRMSAPARIEHRHDIGVEQIHDYSKSEPSGRSFHGRFVIGSLMSPPRAYCANKAPSVGATRQRVRHSSSETMTT